MSGFSLRTEGDHDLPPLAWCARVRTRSSEVVVRHGRDVETCPHGLIEGAWDGDFAAMAFDRATFVAGTGVSVRDGRLRFVAGSGRENRIYAARRGDDLFVSNSLTFTLVAAGDEPGVARRDQAGEIRRQIRFGPYGHTPYRMTFHRGSVDLFELRDLAVDPTLRLTGVSKAASPEPRGFTDLVALLDGLTARTIANATDGARRRCYRPLATLSRGYDAAATAVLAARHGCREAITFSESMPGVADPHDDGTCIGARLGMSVLGRARLAWRTRADLPEAEACATPPAKALPFSSIEDEIAGRLLITGKCGDTVFARAQVAPDALRLRANPWTSSPSVQELRLRTGFIYCSPLYALRPHVAALVALSNSAELAPYCVGGDYDRPIPRRIVEEAGVERATFGQRKIAGAFSDVRWEDQLGPISRRDFAAFVAEHPDLPTVVDLPLRKVANTHLYRARQWLELGLRRLRLPPPPRLGDWPMIDDPRLFHWGFARTRRRYEGRAP